MYFSLILIIHTFFVLLQPLILCLHPDCFSQSFTLLNKKLNLSKLPISEF